MQVLSYFGVNAKKGDSLYDCNIQSYMKSPIFIYPLTSKNRYA